MLSMAGSLDQETTDFRLWLQCTASFFCDSPIILGHTAAGETIPAPGRAEFICQLHLPLTKRTGV